ncbi:MAG: efflux RND transporter periplasmic adaptor subunit [Myxococcales bacterium]
MRPSALLLLAAACGAPKAAAPDGAAQAPRPSEANAQISVAQVEEETVGRAIESSARVVFDENRVAHVFSPVTGRVTQIVAQLGDHVKPGQTLAFITSPDMGNAVSDVYKAKPAVIQAEKELKRQKELYAAQAGPLRDLEAAQANYDQAVAELQRAQAKLRLLERTFHTDHVSQSFPLQSPIEGEVMARSINPGLDVQGQYSGGTTQELYTVGSEGDLWVLADVYEQDLPRVKVGAPVAVTTVAYPDRSFAGKVDWISGTLDPVQRTATVRCTLENPGGLLKSQMYATVAIQTEGKKTLAIPRDAVLHFGDKQMVIGVDPIANRYVREPVILDEDQAGDWVPVLHGLEPGDRIVTRGAILLSEAVN